MVRIIGLLGVMGVIREVGAIWVIVVIWAIGVIGVIWVTGVIGALRAPQGLPQGTFRAPWAPPTPGHPYDSPREPQWHPESTSEESLGALLRIIILLLTS